MPRQPRYSSHAALLDGVLARELRRVASRGVAPKPFVGVERVDGRGERREQLGVEPEPRYRRGVLANYATLVASASLGAVTLSRYETE